MTTLRTRLGADVEPKARRGASFLPRATRRPLSVSGAVLFRWLAVGCQAATLVITWPLWQVHQTPPMLPALPLPQVDLGLPLLMSLGIILITPLAGVALHTGLMVYAASTDQTRLQPEVVSLIFLLWGSLPLETGKAFARAHLLSLWIFSGINKLLSPAFLDGTAQWILAGLIKNPPPLLRENVGYIIALTELGVGLLALFPGMRRLAAAAALLLHSLILLNLSPVGHSWNEAVWPWNVVLALSGFALIAPWRDTALQSLSRLHHLVRPVVVLVAAAPIGFYFAITDAYLAHNLYTSNTPTAEWCRARGRCESDPQTVATFRAFKVPLPPEHRLLEAYFQQTCQPGERMIIQDPRAWAHSQGYNLRTLTCPAANGRRGS